MKYKCCRLLKHGLCFWDKYLVSCCFSPNDQIEDGRPPMFFRDYNGEILSKEFIFSKIKEYTEIFKKGGCPKECLNCSHIEERDWDEEEYIDYVVISHFSPCQADCIYCTNIFTQDDKNRKTYDILPILKSLKLQGIFKQGMEFHIGGGEFTIYPECDEIIEEFALSDSAAMFVVPTNAIKYSEKLSSALKNGRVKLVVSLDAGCRKTYKKIKRVDSFDSVVNNLKKYYVNKFDIYSLNLKYIIIPSVNDNYKEFNKFLNIAKDIGISRIIIDIDAKYARLLNYHIDEYLIHFAHRLYDLSKQKGLYTEMYSFIQQCEESKSYYKKLSLLKSFIKYKCFNKVAKKLYGHIK